MWNAIQNALTNILLLILSVLSILDLLDMYGIEVKPFRYSQKKREKEWERIAKTIHTYMDNEKNFFKNNIQQYIGYTLAEMGLKHGQSDKLLTAVEDLKKANNVIKSEQDMKQIIWSLLRDKRVLVHLDRTDQTRTVIYPSLKYYINFTDAMNYESISAQVLSVLHFYIEEIWGKKGISTRDIDKIVIPAESNVVLGIRLAKLLEAEPVIMLNRTRRIYDDQYWDGTLEEGDKLLIVHDVIYSGDNIVECIHHLPRYCSILGVVSLVNRTDRYKGEQGKRLIEATGVPVHSAVDINDDLLDELKDQT